MNQIQGENRVVKYLILFLLAMPVWGEDKIPPYMEIPEYITGCSSCTGILHNALPDIDVEVTDDSENIQCVMQWTLDDGRKVEMSWPALKHSNQPGGFKCDAMNAILDTGEFEPMTVQVTTSDTQ